MILCDTADTEPKPSHPGMIFFLDALCKRNLFINFLYSRSHSVWKMTYAINLTLLVLLINMVIVFGATMVNNIL